MDYIKINGNLYSANVTGKLNDRDWDGRASRTIAVEMDYATASELFIDGAEWSIVNDVERPQEDGSIAIVQEEYDNSDYCVAGPITDNRDGTMIIKMGKLTELAEAYEMLLGGAE